MWGRSSCGFVLVLASMLLLNGTGCNLTIQPWTKPAPGQKEPDAPGAGNGPNTLQGPLAKQFPPAMQGSTNEILVQMNKQINEADDHRKALQEQLQIVKSQLKEREESLRLASHEMEESSVKLKHTRENFQQWENEVSDLRERVRKLEENRRDMGKMVEAILHEIDRKGEPNPLPSLERQLK